MAGHGSKKVIFAALAGNALISITKFGAAFFTGSSAMLSEGIHSLVDTGNQGLLLYGMHRAKKPSDAQFPFGHGKEIYFWSFLVALLVFAIGALLSIYEGIHHIMHPQPVSDPTINYAVLGFAFLFEGAAWWMAFKEFRKTKGKLGYFEAIRRGKDPIVFTVLFEDSAAMLGLVVAFMGIFLSHQTGLLWLDGAASVLIGLILAVTALFLAIKTKSLLIGEGADEEVVAEIHSLLNARAAEYSVNEIATLHMGPEFIIAAISVDYHSDAKVQDIEEWVSQLTLEIKLKMPLVKRVFLEVESEAAHHHGIKNSNSKELGSEGAS